MLTESQITEYRSEGFLLLEDVFDTGDIAALRREVTDLYGTEHPGRIFEEDGTTVRGIHGCHTTGALFSRLVRLPELLTAAGIDVVGSLADGALAEAAVRELEPDLVLMDLSMPTMDGIEATRTVLAARPETKVIILTSYAEHARLHAALEAGAVGYLLKDADPEEIIRGLRDAATGGVPLSPRAAAARILSAPLFVSNVASPAG